MSLRDQLLKAGLASKKQAKRAEQSTKLERRKTLKSDRHGADVQEDEIVLKIRQEQEERQNKDRELNFEIERQRREMEKFHQAKEIIVSHDLRERYANMTYRFVVDHLYIKSIQVTFLQLRKLAEGELGIASLKTEDDQFYILSASDCEKVRAAEPSFIVCLHPPLLENEQLDYRLIEDEYHSKLNKEGLKRRSQIKDASRGKSQHKFRSDVKETSLAHLFD